MSGAFKVLRVIRLLFETADSMNESVRLYIITGDPMYLSIYKDNADSRAGKLNWSSIPDEVVGYNGPQQSIKELIKDTEFSEEERKVISNILILNDELLWKDIEILNIAQGFSDPDGIAKKKFEEMENKTYVEFSEHSDTESPIENKKRAIEFLKTINQRQAYNKLMEETNLLNKLVAERLQYNFVIYKWVYFIFYFAVFLMCVMGYFLVKRIPGYEIGMLSIYNNIYIFVTTVMLIFGYEVYNTGINRIRTYIISNEMQEVSSSLTKSARDYVATGDIKYFERYWNIVNVKNGRAPLSELSETFKRWNILPSSSTQENLMITLDDLLEKNNFTQEEKNIFNKASEESSALVWKEIESFNWTKERWDKDNKGRKLFSQRGAKTYIQFTGKYDESELTTTPLEDTDIPNNRPANPKQAAVDNLYSDDYIVASNIIKYYTTEGEVAVNKRIDKTVTRTSTLLYLSCILFILCVLMFHKKGVYEYVRL